MTIFDENKFSVIINPRLMSTFMENTKEFNLGTILSITSGRVFVDMDEIINLLEYIFNTNIMYQQVPVTVDYAKVYLLNLFPNLEGIGIDDILLDENDIDLFLEEQIKVFGNTFNISPIGNQLDYLDARGK